FRWAATVTLLRDGRKIRTGPVASTNAAELVQTIVGRPPAEVFLRPHAPQAIAALRVDSLQVGRVGPVSFEVKAGEVVGLAGLRGAGQNAIGRALSGIDPGSGGTVTLDGRRVALSGQVADAMAAGIRFVTSNRESE